MHQENEIMMAWYIRQSLVIAACGLFSNLPPFLLLAGLPVMTSGLLDRG